jgi:hypothetical protein
VNRESCDHLGTKSDDQSSAACAWNGDLDFNCWETDCGNSFWLEEDTPTGNGMKFCCFCGKSLVTELAEEDPDDDEVVGELL